MKSDSLKYIDRYIIEQNQLNESLNADIINEAFLDPNAIKDAAKAVGGMVKPVAKLAAKGARGAFNKITDVPSPKDMKKIDLDLSRMKVIDPLFGTTLDNLLRKSRMLGIDGTSKKGILGLIDKHRSRELAYFESMIDRSSNPKDKYLWTRKAEGMLEKIHKDSPLRERILEVLASSTDSSYMDKKGLKDKKLGVTDKDMSEILDTIDLDLTKASPESNEYETAMTKIENIFNKTKDQAVKNEAVKIMERGRLKEFKQYVQIYNRTRNADPAKSEKYMDMINALLETSTKGGALRNSITSWMQKNAEKNQ